MDAGFVGLGTMGRAMAANLLKAGHQVRVWNRSQTPVQALVAQRAQACERPAEAFQAGVVISMLADDEAIRQLLLQDDILVHAPRSAIHVNMATTVMPVRATSAKSAKPHSSPPKAAGSFFGDFRTLASVLVTVL